MQRLYWVTVALCAAVYAAMLAWSLPHLHALAGGLAIFDERISGYTPAQARALLSALGGKGRAFYLGAQQWLDTAFPGLLALVLILSYRRLYARGPALVLAAVALIYAAFDYGENALVARLLQAGDEQVNAQLVEATSRLTRAKYAAVAIALVALVPGLMRRWRKGANRLAGRR